MPFPRIQYGPRTSPLRANLRPYKQALPIWVVNRLGTPTQRKRWLPSIIRGDVTMAVAISEPEAGSAATDMTTKAQQVGGDYVLNGAKRWISNGGEADVYLVYTRLSTEPGARGLGAPRRQFDYS